MSDGWRLLLVGGQRAAAIPLLDELAALLVAEGLEPSGPSYGSGAAGIALGFGALAELFPERGLEEQTDLLLTRAIDRLELVVADASLFSGYTGVAFAYDQLAPRLYESLDEAATAELDEQLLALVAAPPPSLHHDLIVGLSGMAVYAAGSRGASRRAILRAIVQALDARAEHTPDGTTWATTPEMTHPSRRAEAPPRLYNLGVAHGVPGVLAALAGAALAGEAGADALLDGGLRWLLAQMRPSGPSGFDYVAGGAQDDAHPTRVAWCYGDAGIAATLAWIARATDRPALRDTAIALGMRAAARDEATSGVVDAGLCHGSAGLMHIYNRLWQTTGDDRFVAPARRCFDRTLAYARGDRGLRGLDGYRLPEWGPCAFGGLLESVGGVALALAAAVGTTEPIWDRGLALSSPVARAE